MKEDYRTTAKQNQGYTPTPKHRVCGNCAKFVSNHEFSAWVRDKLLGRSDEEIYEMGYRKIERSLRCSVGGFAVRKMSSCKIHEFKEP